MCPLCIGTATLLVSGGSSAGGLAALFLKVRGRKRGSVQPQLPTVLGSRQTRSKGKRQA